MTTREELEREIVSRARSWAREQHRDPLSLICRCGKCALIDACQKLDALSQGEASA